MLKDITLGQYFPGDTVIHRLDPRTKIVIVFGYITTLFLMRGLLSYSLMLLFLLSVIYLSRISLKVVLKGMKPLIFIIAFTAIINIFYTPGKTIAEFWIFTVTDQGLITAGYMTARIIMLITGTFFLTYTTSPMSLTDGIERLLNPLKKIHAPVHELAMMMSIALRFIPTLIEETDKIMSAQKARGADFESGNIFKRAYALIPVLVPLLLSAFRRADELSTAMLSRCYNGGEGRTRLHVLCMTVADYTALSVSAFIMTVTIVLGTFGL